VPDDSIRVCTVESGVPHCGTPPGLLTHSGAVKCRGRVNATARHRAGAHSLLGRGSR